ncbi:MAG: DUF2306 domain-containing protein [Flavobacteriaceae bacterium]|nr:DUF2306 domain-containing protein [Flavobacteriaceae bacterium]RZW45608.1 MAG: DUF2306 domain-containing protein [Flavobacteriaceae bacterium]
MMNEIIHSTIGLLHTIAAVLAILFGSIVLLNPKGTTFHKRIGYCYVFMMLFLNISSFFIISFGGFSLFHFFAIVSLLTVIAGIVPALRRTKNWFTPHFYFMSWSVVGLYAAFWSELGTRFVSTKGQFWWMVLLATLITVGVGARVINKQAKKLNIKK